MAVENNIHFEDLPEEEKIHDVLPVSGMYKNWFLDYASYVILERAVPAIQDGLKPVQRRILHAMKEVDDGRFNKVANIIGNTMQYHPHGDASISDAIVGLGQKELLIDTQGNWGDIRTGDKAAAARYIEARLSKFALDVVFNPQTTEWQLSYDGRKKEPVTLPVKFPLLLAQGVEGIAVGLSTKILPHNFNELIEASVNLLKNKKIEIYPDFPTGGKADVGEYNKGLRGGKIRVRARIEELDNKTLIIKDIPYGITTTTLIESIIKASDKGKIKIKKVVDNTAQDVEILVYLAPGQSPHITIDALYAFTDCEVSISPNSCVILDEKPHFIDVHEILRINTNQTVDLLRRELEIKRSELLEKILFSSLEKIFIENRIYRDIEECETWEAVIQTIDRGLDPFKTQFYREINEDDIVRLTEIKIKRISRYDSYKADEILKKLQDDLAEVELNLVNLVEYAIRYFLGLKEKYGKEKDRKTEIRNFDSIAATVVAANNQKLYVNREDGFVGFGLKKDEYVCECSDLDDVIVFRKDGKFKVSRIAEKVFMGKDILHVAVFNKNDERMVYNMVYLEGKSGKSFVKRFQVLGVTRDKEYDLTKGQKGSKILYFTANPNGEAEVISVNLTSGCKARKKVFDFDFSELDIKGRVSQGNILTRYPVRKIQLKSAGISTLGGLDIWYDSTIGRLNRDSRGKYLGNFKPEDKIIVITQDGHYALTSFDLTNRYDADKVIFIDQFQAEHIFTAVYFHGGNRSFYVKRFQIETLSSDKKFNFISDDRGSRLEVATNRKNQKLKVHYDVKRKDAKKFEVFSLDEMIEVKGWKALGNKLSASKIKRVELMAAEQSDVNETKTTMKYEPSEDVERAAAGSYHTGRGSEQVIIKSTKVEQIRSGEQSSPKSLKTKISASLRQNKDRDKGSLSSEASPEGMSHLDSSQNNSVEDKVEKIKSVQKKRKDSKASATLPNPDETSPEKNDDPVITGLKSDKENERIPLESAQQPLKGDKEEIYEVGSTIDLNFDPPSRKNDQLGLFKE